MCRKAGTANANQPASNRLASFRVEETRHNSMLLVVLSISASSHARTNSSTTYTVPINLINFSNQQSVPFPVFVYLGNLLSTTLTNFHMERTGGIAPEFPSVLSALARKERHRGGTHLFLFHSSCLLASGGWRRSSTVLECDA